MNNDDAEDITQNVFFKYYQKKNVISKPQAWLARTCRLEIQNHLRKTKILIDIDSRRLREIISSKLSFDETRHIMEEIMSTIHEDDRRLLNMIAIRNISFTQAAIILGLTIRRIRYRYYNIELQVLNKLRKRGIIKLDDLL